jgi:hypothetical protein
VFNSIVALDLASNVRRALPVARSLAELGDLPMQLLTVSPPWVSEQIDTCELERIADGHDFTPHSWVIEHESGRPSRPGRSRAAAAACSAPTSACVMLPS